MSEDRVSMTICVDDDLGLAFLDLDPGWLFIHEASDEFADEAERMEVKIRAAQEHGPVDVLLNRSTPKGSMRVRLRFRTRGLAAKYFMVKDRSGLHHSMPSRPSLGQPAAQA